MEIIVLTGVPASGKSSFYEREFKDTHVRVNLDILVTRKNENDLIAKCIKENKSFVVDNTNIKPLQRKKYIDLAKENNCKVISYYIPMTKEIAIKRNSLREGKSKVPNVVIYTMLNRIVKPSKEEGFDEVHIISQDMAS